MYSDDSDCQIVDDVNMKSVSCDNIPEAFLDKVVAKEHFKQFGKITRFILRPKRLSCTIEYDTPEAAEYAVTDAGFYKDYTFDVYWTPSDMLNSKPTNDIVDPDVQAELDAMSSNLKQNAVAQESFLKKNDRLSNTVSNVKQPVFTPKPIIKPKLSEAESESRSKQYDAANHVRQELLQLAKKPALTAEEKYQILDMRDKFIRLSMDKTTDISQAKYTTGTCADLCPEKERWMREATSQVTSFEQLQNSNSTSSYSQQIDHFLAIKQYSRSSADQESPLPYELRSEKALRLTMNYLLKNIINLLDDNANRSVNISDWYHFLWDRTRSLRKDITQQVLCSQTVVEIVEQCVRFHIHCSARLVEEDPSVFDQKINTENLTKCLQTLKYMYNDLALKNQHCKNEAEFRGYIVLLNLNDGNFLWEIKQLSKTILNSQEIRFALAVYFAIENNNYVKFFNLVRQTTYMNACILHRYFVQMRLSAIQVIMKGYQVKAAVQFNLNYFTKILAFESDEHTVQFLEFHGLTCNREQGSLLMDKKMFYYPDVPYTMERAINIIERKRDRSAAALIFGDDEDILEQSMLELKQHIPHSSFDRNGYLLKQSISAADQNFSSKITEMFDSRDDNVVFKVPSPAPPLIAAAKTNATKTLNSETPATNNLTIPKKSLFTGFTSSSSNNTSFNLGIEPLKPALPKAPASSIFANSVLQLSEQKAADKSIFSTSSSNITVIENKPSAPLPRTEPDGIFGGFKSPPTFPAPVIPAAKPLPLLPPKENDNIFGSSWSFKNATSPSFSFATPPKIESDKCGLNFIDTQRGSSFSPAISNKSDELRLKQIALEEEAKRKEQELAELKRVQKKLEEEELAKQQRMRLLKEQEETEAQQRMKEAIESIYTEIRDEVVAENVKTIAAECLEAINYENNILPEKLLQEVIEEVIEEDLKEMCHYELMSQNLGDLYNLKMLHKYFKLWYKNVGKMQTKRNRIENTPSWLPNESIDEQVQNYSHPLQQDNLLDMKRYLSGKPAEIKLPEDMSRKIDVVKLVKSKLFKTENRNRIGLLRNYVYWKLTISIPFKNEENSAGFYSYIDKWLGNILLRPEKDAVEHHYFYLDEYKQKNSTETLVNCIRKLRGHQLINEVNEKCDSSAQDNSNGVIFILHTMDLHASADRLVVLLENAQIWGPVPLAIIVYHSSPNQMIEESELVECLNLNDLLDESKITEYKIFQNSDLKLNLENTLVFLADNYCIEFNLEMQMKTAFVSSTLGQELWNRLKISAVNNHVFREISYDINMIVAIFNEAVDRIVNIVMHDFSNYPEFPEEFRALVPKSEYDIKLDYEHFPVDWRDEDRQTELKTFFETLKLEVVADPNWMNKATWQDLERMLQKFVHTNLGDGNEKIVYKIINHISQYYSSNSDDHFPDDKLNKISWIDVVQIVAIARLNAQWNSKEQIENPLPDEIIYNKKEFDSFLQSPWWLKNDRRLQSHQHRTASDRGSVSSQDTPVVTGEPEPKKMKLSKEEIEQIINKGISIIERQDATLHEYQAEIKKRRNLTEKFETELYHLSARFSDVKKILLRWSDE